MKTKIRTTATGILAAVFVAVMFFAGAARAESGQALETAESQAVGEATPAGAMALVNLLTDRLDVTEKQASGGAGSLFNMARGLLSETDYGQVAEAVPGIGDLIKAAPDVSQASSRASDKISELTQGLGAVTDAVDNAKKYAVVYEQFKKLGLDTDMVSKFIPVILSFVESSGGETVMKILKSVWE
jgi:hypothetical protein